MEDKKVQDMTVASWVRLQNSKEGKLLEMEGKCENNRNKDDKGKWWKGIRSKNGKKRKAFKKKRWVRGGRKKEYHIELCVTW